MNIQVSRASQLAWGIGVRAVLVGGLGMLLVRLLSGTQLYATAMIVAGVATWVIVDLGRLIARADRSAEQLLNLLHAGVDTPLHDSASYTDSTAFARAALLLRNTRSQSQQQVEHLQCLLDTVAACLLIVTAEGRVTLANRAAHQLAAGPADRLQDIAAIGPHSAGVLLQLNPGAGQIIHLANGQPMLAGAALFSLPGAAPARLISLQRIAGELDAVELKAWQDIARVLAHEMMNSLTPISSLSESLEYLLRDTVRRRASRESQESDAHAEEIASALEAIKRRSLGLMNFVERYRQVAELPKPSMQRLLLDKFLGNIEHLMAASFKDKKIAYTRTMIPSDLSCHADPELLEQAIINLLRNASDAVAEVAQPRITVHCAVQDERLHIAIGDNGCGLSAGQREQIFVPFFTTKPGGSGIGLSLARHIALAHGGQLQVAANHPEGTTFSVILPIATDATTNAALT